MKKKKNEMAHWDSTSWKPEFDSLQALLEKAIRISPDLSPYEVEQRIIHSFMSETFYRSLFASQFKLRFLAKHFGGETERKEMVGKGKEYATSADAYETVYAEHDQAFADEVAGEIKFPAYKPKQQAKVVIAQIVLTDKVKASVDKAIAAGTSYEVLEAMYDGVGMTETELAKLALYYTQQTSEAEEEEA